MFYVLMVLGVIVVGYVGYNVLVYLLFRNDPFFRALRNWHERSQKEFVEIIDRL